MPPFRWPSIQQDLALAREVAARKPEKTSDWDAVSLALSQAFSTDENVITLKLEVVEKGWSDCFRNTVQRMQKD